MFSRRLLPLKHLGWARLSTGAPTQPTSPATSVSSVVEPTAELSRELTGLSESVRSRTVRIFRPAKTSTQSGVAKTGKWYIKFDVAQRWENPLMGWTSSGDPVQALELQFESEEAAVRFATKQGWKYEVEVPKDTSFKSKSYANNFKFQSNRLKFIHTK